MKIKNSKLIKYIFLTVVAYILLGIIFLLMFRQSSVSDNTSFFKEVSSVNRDYIGHILNLPLETLESKSSIFYEYEKNTDDENKALLKHLVNLSVFKDIAFLDTKGVSLSYYHGSTDLSRREYFKEGVNGKPYISEPLISDYTGESIMVFSSPVFSGENVSGVLCGIIPVDEISAALKLSSYNGNASNYIVSADGDILVFPENDMILSKLEKNIYDISGFSINIKNEYLKSNGFSESFRFSMDGKNYYAGYDLLGINNWAILTVLPEMYVDDMTRGTGLFVALFTILFVIFGAAVVILLLIRYFKLRMEADESKNKLDNFLYKDWLTGHDSYITFIKNVSNILKRDDGFKYAVLAVDINKFRLINDLLGYTEADKIIIKTANVIARNLNGEETFTRGAADLFFIFIKYENEDDVSQRIERIINDASYEINEIKIVLSFGAYIVTDKSVEIRTIMDGADLARKMAKGNIESSYKFFNVNMLSKIREEKEIENITEQALLSHEFKVYLQPKYDLQDNKRIIGAEALVRWFRDGKLIPPPSFIPLFEKNGFISKLDRYVFEEVCKQQRQWLSRGIEIKIISVNMSRYNINDSSYIRNLAEICQKYNLPPKYFEIEITESVAYENIELLSKVFSEIKQYGFHISIDDFGTGYSSLNMLKDLPVDILKIDRSFLIDAENNTRAGEIISHVISLAVSLKMQTICEGIETEEQVEMLSGLGCDMAQGFYFARPMPMDEYEKLLTDGKSL